MGIRTVCHARAWFVRGDGYAEAPSRFSGRLALSPLPPLFHCPPLLPPRLLLRRPRVLPRAAARAHGGFQSEFLGGALPPRVGAERAAPDHRQTHGRQLALVLPGVDRAEPAGGERHGPAGQEALV